MFFGARTNGKPSASSVTATREEDLANLSERSASPGPDGLSQRVASDPTLRDPLLSSSDDSTPSALPMSTHALPSVAPNVRGALNNQAPTFHPVLTPTTLSDAKESGNLPSSACRPHNPNSPSIGVDSKQLVQTPTSHGPL